MIKTPKSDHVEHREIKMGLSGVEELFKTTFNMAGVGITLHNKDMKLIMVNDQMAKMFGMTKDELLETALEVTTPPEDIELTNIRLKSLLKGETDRYRIERRNIHKDGSIFWVDLSLSPVRDKDGNVVAAIGMSVDITDRKCAEEEQKKLQLKLTNAMEIAHLGHWEYDVASDIFTFNDYFYKIFRTTVSEVGGYTMSSAEYARRFVHPDEISIVGEEVRKAIETTDPNFARQLEHRIIYADGTVGYITVRFFIVKDAHNRTIKTYGVNQDITELKQAEKEKENLIERLQKALSEVKTLQGLLPICANCKNIRDDKGYWNQIESYISDHTMAEFSHSICPACVKKLYPDIDLSEEF